MSDQQEASFRKSVFAIAAADNSQSFSATFLLLIAAVAMVSIHIYQLLNFSLTSGEFRNLHLAFAVIIGFLAMLEGVSPEKKTRRGVFWALAILAVLLAIYIHVEYRALTEVRSFAPSSSDLTVAVLYSQRR